MYYHPNHNHNQDKLNRLQIQLDKATDIGTKAIILHQINRIKQEDAMFRNEQAQAMYNEIYGIVEETAELVEESVKKTRKKKEQE